MSKLVDTFYNRPDAGTCATLQEAKTKSTEGRRKEAATHPIRSDQSSYFGFVDGNQQTSNGSSWTGRKGVESRDGHSLRSSFFPAGD